MNARKHRVIFIGIAFSCLGMAFVIGVMSQPITMTKSPLKTALQALQKTPAWQDAKSYFESKGIYASADQMHVSQILFVPLSQVLAAAGQDFTKARFRSGSWECTSLHSPDRIQLDCRDFQQTPPLKRIWAEDRYETHLVLESSKNLDPDMSADSVTNVTFSSSVQSIFRLKSFFYHP